MSQERIPKDRNNKSLEHPSAHVNPRNIPLHILFWVGIVGFLYLVYRALAG